MRNVGKPVPPPDSRRTGPLAGSFFLFRAWRRRGVRGTGLVQGETRVKQEARYIVDGIHIRDREGRTVMFRGCNLGGDSKIPARPEGNPLVYDVSFLGRPFPEAEADDHFARLSRWGFNFVRFVITWEAVEHAGPGIYDEEYLSYLRTVIKKAEEWGISVYVDPHQDVWSRWTGGDGAPGWTLEAAGFDLSKLAACGAAFTMQSEGSNYAEMSWGLNYLRYAAATMNTLFFGGNAFAPGRLVEGVPIQDWLQDRYIAAMVHTARRLKDCAAIVGFGTFNEPHYGFIGLTTLDAHHRITGRSGAVPTAFQSMAAASGFPQNARRFALAGVLALPGTHTLNPDGVSLFREGYGCPWREAGVWAVEGGKPVVRKPDWFVRGVEGGAPVAEGARSPADGEGGTGAGTVRRPYRFADDFLKPFMLRFAAEMAKKHAHYLCFIEGVPMAERARWAPGEAAALPLVESFHWYDGMTLLFKKFRPWITSEAESGRIVPGRRAVRRSMNRQLADMASYPRAEGIPAMVGEFGVPFDFRHGRSYRTGDYAAQERALGAYYDALDAALLSAAVWNYSASNSHENGDGWNTEDLSIYSASTGEGRAVRGFCRPYAMAVAGMPRSMRFDRKRREFAFEWDAGRGVTEIYVPALWYPEGWRASFEGGSAVLEEKPEAQRLYITIEQDAPGPVSVRIAPAAKKED